MINLSHIDKTPKKWYYFCKGLPLRKVIKLYPVSNSYRKTLVSPREYMESPPVRRTASSKKDMSLAVNDETLEKMRQLGYKDAKSGKQLCGSEYLSLLNHCREKIAPDRRGIDAEAESKMRRISRQLQRETGNSIPIFDYIFKAKRKDKEYRILETSGLSGCGSFRGRCGSTGWINIYAYDENGECIGFHSSDSMRSGGRAIQTEAEKACIHALSAAYAEGTNAYYAEKKAEEQALRKQILSQTDFYA